MARVTVEDCLEQVPNRFALVHLASRRAKQIDLGAQKLIDRENKSIVIALREIAAAKVLYKDLPNLIEDTQKELKTVVTRTLDDIEKEKPSDSEVYTVELDDSDLD